jgi:hypothetical protein
MSDKLQESFRLKLREMIRSALKEMTTTGNVAGFDSPFAFSRKSLTPKLTKRVNKLPKKSKGGYKTIPQGDPNGPSSKLLNDK